ncbi:hypothetical protein DIPPA_26307 [Diplonema papillatum]|nr:hypothetical protein DIPPA_26307 [Diplonema papillatum]
MRVNRGFEIPQITISETDVMDSDDEATSRPGSQTPTPRRDCQSNASFPPFRQVFMVDEDALASTMATLHPSGITCTEVLDRTGKSYTVHQITIDADTWTHEDADRLRELQNKQRLTLAEQAELEDLKDCYDCVLNYTGKTFPGSSAPPTPHAHAVMAPVLLKSTSNQSVLYERGITSLYIRLFLAIVAALAVGAILRVLNAYEALG